MLMIMSLPAFAACSREEAQQISAQEATTEIALAFAAKDSQCGMSHNITYPIINRANKENVRACTAQIVSLTCTAWAAADPTPSLCLIILIDL